MIEQRDVIASVAGRRDGKCSEETASAAKNSILETIVESSSGNFAIGLAQVCGYLGLRLVVDAETITRFDRKEESARHVSAKAGA